MGTQEKLVISVATDTMVFTATEQKALIPAVASRMDRTIDQLALQSRRPAPSEEQRRHRAVSTVYAALGNLDGERAGKVRDVQAVLVENLLYLIAKLPPATLKGLCGVLVMPEDETIRFVPFTDRTDYDAAMVRLRDAYRT